MWPSACRPFYPDYDAEVIEIHHNVKKDSPSGTAQRLAEAVQRGRTSGRFVYGRHGLVGERTKEEIGVHAVRGGDVVGDHTVLYLGNGERVELVHRVTSRTALHPGLWQPPNGWWGSRPDFTICEMCWG